MLLREDTIGEETRCCVYDTIQDISPGIWDAIRPNAPFYQQHKFLSVIENIQPDLQFRYALLKKNEEIIAAVYMQLLNFSYRNLVNYSGESKGLKNRFKKYMSKKEAKLLHLGDVFFTGDKGILSENEEAVIPLLPEICRQMKKSFGSGKPSAYLIANIYLEDEGKCKSFCDSSFHPFITEPDMFLFVREEWNTFDDYMNALSSKYRVRAKKVLTVSRDIIQKPLSLEDIVEQKDALEKLYNNVVNHVAFNMATLNTEFFPEMKKKYGDACTVFGYYLGGEMVGFACLFHVDPGFLHVHYIGLNYDVNKTYKLYNRMLLDFVKFAIERKVPKVHFGRTATEIKSTIGAEPNPLQAYLKMNNRVMNASLPFFLKRIVPPEYVARNPFK